MKEESVNPYFDNLETERKLEILDQIVSVKQDYIEKELATAKWFVIGIGGLVTLMIGYFENLQKIGLPRIGIIIVFCLLVGSFVFMLKAYLGFLDQYKLCGRLRIEAKSGATSNFRLTQVEATAVDAHNFRSLLFSVVLLSLAGLVLVVSLSGY